VSFVGGEFRISDFGFRPAGWVLKSAIRNPKSEIPATKLTGLTHLLANLILTLVSVVIDFIANSRMILAHEYRSL
jgi:acetoacetate decarboxylase